jgi:hypothetical protein
VAIQVRIFTGKVDKEGSKKLEEEINAWLAKPEQSLDKSKLVNVALTPMGEKNLTLAVSIWYEAPASPAKGKPWIHAGGKRASADYPGGS